MKITEVKVTGEKITSVKTSLSPKSHIIYIFSLYVHENILLLFVRTPRFARKKHFSFELSLCQEIQYEHLIQPRSRGVLPSHQAGSRLPDIKKERSPGNEVAPHFVTFIDFVRL